MIHYIDLNFYNIIKLSTAFKKGSSISFYNNKLDNSFTKIQSLQSNKSKFNIEQNVFCNTTQQPDIDPIIFDDSDIEEIL